MNTMYKTILTAFLIFMTIQSCKQDELDMELLSEQVETEYTIVAPLIHGNLFLRTLMDGDSVLIVEEDSVFTDTFGFQIGEDETNGFELEFFDLHYSNKNYLPVAFDLWFVTYDSITSTNLDTIKFVDEGYFLNPATINENGNAIEELVDSVYGKLTIDNAMAENILNVATHIILEARLMSDTTVVIPVNDNKKIWFKYGFEAKGKYQTNLSSNEEEN